MVCGDKKKLPKPRDSVQQETLLASFSTDVVWEGLRNNKAILTLICQFSNGNFVPKPILPKRVRFYVVSGILRLSA
jgi:hypothetical protein